MPAKSPLTRWSVYQRLDRHEQLGGLAVREHAQPDLEASGQVAEEVQDDLLRNIDLHFTLHDLGHAGRAVEDDEQTLGVAPL
jgi:hypothetical protein